MSWSEDDAQRISADARRICEERGTGVAVTLIGAIGGQFVLIFHIGSLAQADPITRDREISEIAKRLHDIQGVARVLYEVLPDRARAH